MAHTEFDHGTYWETYIYLKALMKRWHKCISIAGGRLSTRFWSVTGICAQSIMRALLRSGADVVWEDLGCGWCFSSVPRCSLRLWSGILIGKLFQHHVFKEFTMCSMALRSSKGIKFVFAIQMFASNNLEKNHKCMWWSHVHIVLATWCVHIMQDILNPKKYLRFKIFC